MSINKRNFFAKSMYAISSNFVSLIISTLVVLLVPKLIGVEEYGYWQLYILYSSYVGFFHLGWIDGIYLRYGGEDIKKLKRAVFLPQIVMFVVFQLFIAITLYFSLEKVALDENKHFILIMVSIIITIVNLRTFLIYILQATDNIREASVVIITEKIIYLLFIIYSVIIKVQTFELLILSDLIGKVVSLLLVLYYSKTLILHSRDKLIFSFREIFTNVKVGFSLLIANLSGMFNIGIIRLFIEKFWDITTFGMVSLVLSISNLFLIFISALSTVLYPSLRRIDSHLISEFYVRLKVIMNVFLYMALLFYFPLNNILREWLPSYNKAFDYLLILMPLTIFEGRMVILISTFLKSLRKEKSILILNLSALLFTVIGLIYSFKLTITVEMVLTIYIFGNIMKSLMGEILLSRYLKVKVLKFLVYDLLIVSGFFISNNFSNNYLSMLSFSFILGIYFYRERKVIRNNLLFIKV